MKKSDELTIQEWKDTAEYKIALHTALNGLMYEFREDMIKQMELENATTSDVQEKLEKAFQKKYRSARFK